jgi:hypothetical protein
MWKSVAILSLSFSLTASAEPPADERAWLAELERIEKLPGPCTGHKAVQAFEDRSKKLRESLMEALSEKKQAPARKVRLLSLLERLISVMAGEADAYELCCNDCSYMVAENLQMAADRISEAEESALESAAGKLTAAEMIELCSHLSDPTRFPPCTPDGPPAPADSSTGSALPQTQTQTPTSASTTKPDAGVR